MNDVLQVLQERFLLQKEFLGDEKPINKVQPLVSVSVPTYQHSRYISECLDGILMQQTSFPIEIIIGEDGSTDGTREICEEYAIKHQDKIRLFNRDRELSQYVDREGHVTRFNGIWNRMSARGKYIAMCEGDDYWTDPLKLQKQVDFLEKHSEYGLIHTNFKTKTNHDVVQGRKLLRVKSGNVFKSLIYGTYKSIGTLTVVYRKDLYDRIPKVFETKKYKMGDYPLFIEMSFYSKFKYLKHPTAVYRILQDSASHKTDPIEQIQFLESHHQCRLDYAKYFNIEVKEKKLLSILYNNIISTFYHKDIKSIYIDKYFKEILHLGYSYIKMRSLVIFICHKSQFISRLVNRVI